MTERTWKLDASRRSEVNVMVVPIDVLNLENKFLNDSYHKKQIKYFIRI